MTDGASELRDRLLPACTVRVHVDGVQKGTGFFSEPGMIVTCEHVVHDAALGTGGPKSITVVHDTKEYAVTLKPESSWPDDDLALLQLQTRMDHPCVLLDPDHRSRDPLHSYGFTERYPDGVPTILVSEGSMRGGRWLKLTDGQVLPGMSGSPVLNLRTGAVCGVVKRTRDEEQALGGYAVLVSELYRLQPALRSGNRRFHEVNSDWFDLLTSDQQNLVDVWPEARPAAPVAFVVRIGQTESGWQVWAYGPRDRTTGPIRVDLNTARQEVARLFRNSAWRNRVDEGEHIRILGGILFSAAFPAEIRHAFWELLEGRDRRPIMLGLQFADGTDADLVNLPWEHLYAPCQPGVYLATDPGITFVRTQVHERMDQAAPRRQSYSALVVVIKPGQDDNRGYRGDQVTAIAADLKDLRSDGFSIATIENPTPDELAQAVSEGGPDVLHYVGFGRFQNGVDELVLGSESSRTEFEPVAGDVLKQVLAEGARRRRPRFVVLELCEGPGDSVPADFAPIAAALVGPDLPAVLGFQYPMSADDARKFNTSLYGSLATGAPVRRAVQEARKKLRWTPRSRAFAAPALFVSRPGDLRLVAGSSEPDAVRTSVLSGA